MKATLGKPYRSVSRPEPARDANLPAPDSELHMPATKPCTKFSGEDGLQLRIVALVSKIVNYLINEDQIDFKSFI